MMLHHYYAYDNLSTKGFLLHLQVQHDGNKKQSIKILSDSSIVFRLHVSEFGPENPTHLKGIFYNKDGQPDDSGATPIYINAPIKGS